MKFKVVVDLVMLAVFRDIKLREEAQETIQFYTGCVNGKHLPYVFAVELQKVEELICDTGVDVVTGYSDEVKIGWRYIRSRVERGCHRTFTSYG